MCCSRSRLPRLEGEGEQAALLGEASWLSLSHAGGVPQINAFTGKPPQKGCAALGRLHVCKHASLARWDVSEQVGGELSHICWYFFLISALALCWFGTTLSRGWNCSQKCQVGIIAAAKTHPCGGRGDVSSGCGGSGRKGWAGMFLPGQLLFPGIRLSTGLGAEPCRATALGWHTGFVQTLNKEVCERWGGRTGWMHCHVCLTI